MRNGIFGLLVTIVTVVALLLSGTIGLPWHTGNSDAVSDVVVDVVYASVSETSPEYWMANLEWGKLTPVHFAEADGEFWTESDIASVCADIEGNLTAFGTVTDRAFDNRDQCRFRASLDGDLRAVVEVDQLLGADLEAARSVMGSLRDADHVVSLKIGLKKT